MQTRTRTLNEVLLYKLVLNPMTDRAESQRIAAISYDRQKLIDWCESLKVEMYKDDRFNKQFQQGSPLEWFNPLYGSYDTIETFGHGIYEEWVVIDSVKQFIDRTGIPLIL